MNIYHLLINVLWIVFLGYWIIKAMKAKQNLNPINWRRHISLRIGIMALAISLLHFPEIRKHAATTNHGMEISGVVLCALGVGLAIWARHSLGANWGMPMSRKEDPKLVTTGPYAYIRHPIYSGSILAMLGTTLADSLLWVIPLLMIGIYFIYSARHEEMNIMQQFPEQYAAYQKGTKMFIPFLF